MSAKAAMKSKPGCFKANKRFWELTRLWILSDKIGTDILTNEVMDILAATVAGTSMIPRLSVIRHAYEHTAEVSSLRQFYAATMASCSSIRGFRDESAGKDMTEMPEFQRDVIRACGRTVSGIRSRADGPRSRCYQISCQGD